MLLIAPEAYPNLLELPPWRVLIVRSEHEGRVAELLGSKADECYLPTYRSVRRWHDRRITLDLALFPTYLFARFDWNERDLVLRSYGLQRILSYANVPAVVNEAEICIIAQMVASGRQIGSSSGKRSASRANRFRESRASSGSSAAKST